MSAQPLHGAPDPPLVPHAFTTSLDPKVILSTLVDRASEILGASRAAVVRLDPERHPGQAFVFAATDDPSIEGYALALADYPEIEAVVEQGRSLLVHDHPSDAIAAKIRARHRKLPFPLSVLFPLTYRERSFGVLFLRFAASATLRREDLEFCELVAFGAAVALHNAREHEQALAELRRREHETERLEEAHRLRMEMFSSASHDLRTPLHSVVGYVDLLLESAYGDVMPDQREALGHVAASALSLLDIINNLVDYARIEEGRHRLDVSLGEVPRLLEEIRFTIEPLAQQRGLELAFESDGKFPAVRTDWGKLRRLLLNLLHNAIKFTEHGKVSLRAWMERGRLWFDVVDTGAGIAREHVEQIFDRFYRVDPSRADDPGGLGLAIVKRHCELLRGTVSVKSRRGRGTRFRVSVPFEVES